jgi:CheY-like chemotaxis protein
MPSSGPVVLLVTSHEDSLAMYAMGLLAFGFQPVTATDAEHAFARACECRPDAIVADEWLPRVSIHELVRRLRDDPRTKPARLIVLTCAHSGSAEQWTGSDGPDLCLPLPCLPDALSGAIWRLLAPLIPSRAPMSSRSSTV